ncbi:hypothetical protein JCM8547_000572 [Rhodosporidiobolus lusitaniae]
MPPPAPLSPDSATGAHPPSSHPPPAITRYPRPSSARSRPTSASSSRPWQFDPETSSVCSASSTGPSGQPRTAHDSNGLTRPADETVERRVLVNPDGSLGELVDEGGEVYKAPGDMEFLDHRPEPPGASLSIDRSDPSQVILLVTLPGFTLENITVAMRRGHKVHIVADSYDEGGGHFEKLVTLGSDVASSAPRAEFDGNLLRIYIQRRPSRPSSSASTAGSTPAPFGGVGGPSHGPPLTVTTSAPYPLPAHHPSPDVTLIDHTRRLSVASSLASFRSDASNGTNSSSSFSPSPYPPLSPSLEPRSPNSFQSFFAAHAASSNPLLNSDDPLPDPPCTARASPHPSSFHPHGSSHAQKRSKSLIGPEGARAAAKAAKEALAQRAREEARSLPKEARGGRHLPFREQKEGGEKEEKVGENGGATPRPASVVRSCGSSTNSSMSDFSCTTSGGEHSSSSGSGGFSSGNGSSTDATSASENDASPPLAKALSGAVEAPGVERSATIKASSSLSTSSSPAVSPSMASATQGYPTMLGATSPASSSSAASSTTAASSPSTPPASSPSTIRPKLKGHSLTLRSLSDAAASAFGMHHSSSTEITAEVVAEKAKEASSESASGSSDGGITPRREQEGMRFTTVGP